MLPLAEHASAYRSRRDLRPPADPIGERGLPATRPELNVLLHELCARLMSAAGSRIRGSRLVEELNLRGPRSLRLLVAYGRVHRHLHQIVGLPGDGYCWGEFAPAVYGRTIKDNERRARCHFFIAALHRRRGTAMAAVQMIFDFMEHQVPADHRRNDDLAALVASEGVGVTDFLDAFITELAGTEEGKNILQRVGAKHSQVLLPRAVLAEALDKLDQARGLLTTAGRSA